MIYYKEFKLRNFIRYILFTIDSQYKEPRREMANSSLYQEFAISRNLKIAFFGQILNSKLDLYLKLK